MGDFWHITLPNINIFNEVTKLYSLSTIKLHVLVVIQFLFKCGFNGQNHKNCTKSAIPQFATFTQLQSLKKLHTLHFSIFPLEILNVASQLNLAANYCILFLNFNFGAILATLWHNFPENCAKVGIQKSKTVISCQI